MKEKLEKYILDNVGDLIFRTIIGIILSILCIKIGNWVYVNYIKNYGSCNVVEKAMIGRYGAPEYYLLLKCEHDTRSLSVEIDEYVKYKVGDILQR